MAALREADGPDAYATLGVEVTATTADIRRAYRLLALRHHPDRAGPDGTERFREIAEAYGVLSNPEARAVYDTRRRYVDERAKRARPRVTPLARVSGDLETLLANGIARRATDGAIELELTAVEASTGGAIVVEANLTVRCDMCGGISRPNGLWCRRCEFTGTIRQLVALEIAIPPSVDSWTFAVTPDHVPGVISSLQFRLRVRR